MKTVMMMIAVLATAASAQADGFVCQSEGLTVKVYNKTHASEGTRNGAVMIVSNPDISSGRKTIAKFDADNAVLSSNGAKYVADVDLRFSNSARKGELIGGTKLGYIDTLTLDVDFTFSAPVEANEEIAAELTILKRDGSRKHIAMDCARYLKN